MVCMTTLAILTLVAAGASLVVAGVFFAFSSFVMRALDSLAAAEAVASMRAINRFAVTPAFMLVLFGSAALAVGCAVVAVVNATPGFTFVIAGAAANIIGVIGTTIGANVPLNDRLAEADDTDPAAIWAAFVRPWVRANTVRTLAGVVSAALLAVGTLLA
jgi:uncharacterized membrane protein